MKFYSSEKWFDKIKYIKTGEYRCPKKGEYFLSGAIPEAYEAPNNLTQKYYIAKPVKTKIIEVIDEGV